MAKKALVIVAHPDDETIWMGGTILQKSDWEWTILSLCRGSDTDRAPKFRRVCAHYGARAVIADIDDENDEPISVGAVQEIILGALDSREYDFIFTHGSNGEYGHQRHLDAHRAVTKLCNQNTLKGKLYFFSYVPGKESAPHDPALMIPVPSSKADWIVELSEAEWREKRRIVEELYGFKHPIFETLACARTEAFDVHF